MTCPIILGCRNGHRWCFAIDFGHPSSFVPPFSCLCSQHASTFSSVFLFFFFRVVSCPLSACRHVPVIVFEHAQTTSISLSLWFIYSSLQLYSFLPSLPKRSVRVMHFGYVCQSVCMSVRTRNSKTIAPIDLIVYTRSNMPAVLL